QASARYLGVAFLQFSHSRDGLRACDRRRPQRAVLFAGGPDTARRVALGQDAHVPLPRPAVRHLRGELSSRRGRLRVLETTERDRALPRETFWGHDLAGAAARYPARAPRDRALRQRP